MYWIIEPHTDDAFLSLHEHIIGPWYGLPKTIITCYGSGSIIDEARYYAHATGCSHSWLGLKETGWIEFDPMPPVAEWLPELKHGDVVVLPVGIRQPAHIAIASINFPADADKRWYLDAKYVQSIAREEVQQKVAGMRVVSILASSIDKGHYKNIFQSQAHRFLLAPDLYPPPVEIVLTK